MIPFTFWPEMLNYPFFIANGWLPYRDWSCVYTPLFIYLMKFLYDLFGFSLQTYQLAAVMLFCFSIFLVWKYTRRSVWALAFFIPAYFAFGGNAVWFDMFLAPIILLIYFSTNSNLTAFLFGVAVLSKQTAFYLTPLILKDLIKKPLPFLFLLSLFFLYLVSNGLADDFYRWGIQFVFLLPRAGDLSLPTVKQSLVVMTFIISLLLTKNRRAIIFAIFTLLFAFPRFEFFHLLPFLTIFTVTIARKPVLFLIPAIPVIILLQTTLALGNRFVEPEVIKITRNLPNDKSIISLNGPDQIYFLTGKMPAVRPWVDQLPWQMEFAKKEYYQAFITAKPDIILTRPYLKVPVQGLGAYRPEEIWEFVNSNYKVTKDYEDGTQILERN